jgi:hypothetical protein
MDVIFSNGIGSTRAIIAFRFHSYVVVVFIFVVFISRVDLMIKNKLFGLFK